MRSANILPRPRWLPLQVALVVRAGLAAAGLAAAGAFAQDAPATDEWPTLHRDNQRSGHTPEVIVGPVTRKWFRGFAEELITPYSEAIIGDGMVLVGTHAGLFRGLRLEDGSDAWPAIDTGGRIGHSPCYHQGCAFVGTDIAFDHGELVCVDTATGAVLWKFRTGAGIWNSPATDGTSVYVGDRDGTFYAVDAATGEKRWDLAVEGMILTPASVAADGGRIVFASESMRVFCVSPDGELLWRSEQLDGLTLRNYAPTLWHDLVVVRASPSSGFHRSLGSADLRAAHLESVREALGAADRAEFDDLAERRHTLRAARGNLEGDARKEADRELAEIDAARNRLLEPLGEKIWWDEWGQFKMRPTPGRQRVELAAARARLAADPGQRSFFALRIEDGREPWQAPVLYQGGKSDSGAPPCFHPETGALYVWGSGTLSNMSGGVPGNTAALLTIDPKTGVPQTINHRGEGSDDPGSFGGQPFCQPGDESQALSLSGDDLIVNTHMGTLAGMRLGSRAIVPIAGARDTHGGVFGPALVPGDRFASARRAHWDGLLTEILNEWHGPGRGIVSIAAGRMVWIAGSHVVCLAGPDLPAEPSSTTHDPTTYRRAHRPLWPGGNYATLPTDEGAFDPAVTREVPSREALVAFLDRPPHPGLAPDPSGRELAVRERLEAAVRELIGGSDWAPLCYTLGFVPAEIHFARRAESLRVVAESLPFLPAHTRAESLVWLDATWQRLIREPVATPGSGRRRELHRLSEYQLENADKPVPPTLDVADLAGAWAYAHFADRWPAVLAEFDHLQDAWESAAPSRFHPGPPQQRNQDRSRYADGEDRLNQWIAGGLAYARIARKAGQEEALEAALAKLADAVADRVLVERADRAFVLGDGHRAKLARYRNTTPDVFAVLRHFAGHALEANVQTLARQAPAWPHAWGDLLMGGENFTHSPGLARGLFLAFADGLHAQPDQLAHYLDQPLCRADLYDIEKVSAYLRRAAAAPQEEGHPD
ncbi:hypothetical protein BH23VER1_BH23VER1_11350 [soil metagenome]